MRNYELEIKNKWNNKLGDSILKDFLFLKDIIDNYRTGSDSRKHLTYCVLADDLAVLPNASYGEELDNAFRYVLNKYNVKDP